MRTTAFTSGNWVIVVLLIHAFITFYFINNQFVAKKIRLISDANEQEQLRKDFLIPMKMLTTISIWMFVIFVAITIIVDLTTAITKT